MASFQLKNSVLDVKKRQHHTPLQAVSLTTRVKCVKDPFWARHLYSLALGRCTAALSEARTTLPESSSRPLPAKMAHSRNLAHASLETAVRNAAAVRCGRWHDGVRKGGGTGRTLKVEEAGGHSQMTSAVRGGGGLADSWPKEAKLREFGTDKGEGGGPKSRKLHWPHVWMSHPGTRMGGRRSDFFHPARRVVQRGAYPNDAKGRIL